MWMWRLASSLKFSCNYRIVRELYVKQRKVAATLITFSDDIDDMLLIWSFNESWDSHCFASVRKWPFCQVRGSGQLPEAWRTWEEVTFPPRVRAPLVSAGFKADLWGVGSGKTSFWNLMKLSRCGQAGINTESQRTPC